MHRLKCLRCVHYEKQTTEHGFTSICKKGRVLFVKDCPSFAAAEKALDRYVGEKDVL